MPSPSPTFFGFLTRSFNISVLWVCSHSAKPVLAFLINLNLLMLHIIKATSFSLPDLKLDRYELEANPGMAVSVTCSTKRDGKLQWRGPDGEVVAETRHTAASNETGGVQSLSLLLPEVTAENVGDYQCSFQPTEGERRAPETFTLHLKECKS